MKLYSNIKSLREKLGLSQEELAKRVGYKDRTSIAKIEAGKIDLPQSKIVLFAEALGTSPIILMGWSDENPKIAHSQLYDYIPARVSAGSLFHLSEYAPEQIEIPDAILGKHAGKDYLVFMHVNGDSMDRVIDDGALIAVKKKAPLVNGDIVVAYNYDGWTLKRFELDEENNKVFLLPDSNNPKYKPIVIDLEYDEINILGKVIMYNIVLEEYGNYVDRGNKRQI